MLTALLEITEEYASVVQVLLETHTESLALLVRSFREKVKIIERILFSPNSKPPTFIIVPPPPPPGCSEDRECASKEACFNRECKNPCAHVDPCARNAKCEVHSTLPLRTMSCTCLPGFTGKGDVRCSEISKNLDYTH